MGVVVRQGCLNFWCGKCGGVMVLEISVCGVENIYSLTKKKINK